MLISCPSDARTPVWLVVLGNYGSWQVSCGQCMGCLLTYPTDLHRYKLTPTQHLLLCEKTFVLPHEQNAACIALEQNAVYSLEQNTIYIAPCVKCCLHSPSWGKSSWQFCERTNYIHYIFCSELQSNKLVWSRPDILHHIVHFTLFIFESESFLLWRQWGKSFSPCDSNQSVLIILQCLW